MRPQSITHIIGIDEAGRGPLAGPVSIGLVIASKKISIKILKNIRDSKKLSELKREEWFAKLLIWKKEKKLDFHVALISATHIDKFGISSAIRKGMQECLDAVHANPKKTKVLLDGSLYAPKEYLFQQTIIKGDEKEPLISLASIAAKVTRDRYMKKLAKKYPKYQFDVHKGYGTLMHRTRIIEHGPSKVHRLSFLKNIEKVRNS